MIEVLAKGWGKNVEEAMIKCWYFEEGDHVSEGDDLVELMAEESSIVIPVPVSGVLTEVYFDEGENVQRDELICVIDETKGELTEEEADEGEDQEEEKAAGDEEEEEL